MAIRKYTERSFRTVDISGVNVEVVGGWNRKTGSYYLEIYRIGESGNRAGTIFNTREECDVTPKFADLTFILCKHGISYPTKWAQWLISDNEDLLPSHSDPEITRFGFHPLTREEA